MYSVEYRRFYLHDLQCILVWPSRSWWSRLIIPAVLLAALGGSLWLWVDSTTGEIFVGIAFCMGASGTGSRADSEVACSDNWDKR